MHNSTGHSFDNICKFISNNLNCVMVKSLIICNVFAASFSSKKLFRNIWKNPFRKILKKAICNDGILPYTCIFDIGQLLQNAYFNKIICM